MRDELKHLLESFEVAYDSYKRQAFRMEELNKELDRLAHALKVKLKSIKESDKDD
jgi:hypothetical protein